MNGSGNRRALRKPVGVKLVRQFLVITRSRSILFAPSRVRNSAARAVAATGRLSKPERTSMAWCRARRFAISHRTFPPLWPHFPAAEPNDSVISGYHARPRLSERGASGIHSEHNLLGGKLQRQASAAFRLETTYEMVNARTPRAGGKGRERGILCACTLCRHQGSVHGRS
jgi:hypothetical protein